MRDCGLVELRRRAYSKDRRDRSRRNTLRSMRREKRMVTPRPKTSQR